MKSCSVERADAVRAIGPCALTASSSLCALPDPLGEDRADDSCLALTEREVARVVFVAAETGRRFAREGLIADPVAWMYAPRRIFDGAAPVNACVSRHGFVAAMVLHGIWPELDADPEIIADLFVSVDDRDPDPAAATLFTAVLISEGTGGLRQTFYATTALDAEEARSRLLNRIGRAAAEEAQVREGFDVFDPRVRALLPSALHEYLTGIDGEESQPPPNGFELLIDYRLAA